ncbi:MAG: serine/threonine-protein phosphatase [Chloroflexi bacterium]|nr:serine/threonine-protein phosphatase [Chloroflexota bacterium]
MSEQEEAPPVEGLGLEIHACTIASSEHPERNEDAVAYSPVEGYAIVADGVGGGSFAEKASALARDYLSAALGKIPTAGIPSMVGERIMEEMIYASKEISSQLPENAGTTATVAKFIERGSGQRIALIGSVGDSRAYLYRGNELTQITVDDRFDFWMSADRRKDLSRRLDAIETREQLTALSHEDRVFFDSRHLITQSLGRKTPSPNDYPVVLKDGDKVILTTDGIHDNLTFQEIEQILRNPGPGQNLAEALVSRAQKRSLQPDHIRAKPDDMTAIVVYVQPHEEAQAKGHLFGFLKR